MSGATLKQVLEATGYYPDGQPAPGLCLGEKARAQRRGKDFAPDASWRSASSLIIYFKFEDKPPQDEVVSQWRREIWNEGFAPLLWIISPERIDLYNGFGLPQREGDAQKHLIQTFKNVEASLAELDALAGRLALETGQFWAQATKVDRKNSVDQKLLSDLAALERDLVEADLGRDSAQALIGRVIFTQYLIDRGIISPSKLKRLTGHGSFPLILREREATTSLFKWLSQTFNGDMFPPSSVRTTPAKRHLIRVAEFLEATDPESGQQSLFPYQFDVIPVELISSIYEQFAHSAYSRDSRRANSAISNGVHYTRLSVVSLVLDEVMQSLSGHETVLDLTCGSGVFLVEALRRLVHLRSAGGTPTREIIRSTLYGQVYGVDISEAAVRVAAFSLYLAALELDPDPQPPRALKFQPLIGSTLFIGDARTVEHTSGRAALIEEGRLRKFDVIVGNPPWSFKGHAGTQARRTTLTPGVPVQPRGEGLDFVLRAIEFSHETTRFGVILSALPFFSRSGTGIAAALHVMRSLAPITLVNLSNLCSWLFATATMPAVVLFARHREQPEDQVTVVQIPWTASGSKSHTFEVAPSDIIKLTLSDIEARPAKLKAAATGRRRDIALVDALTSAYLPLAKRFEAINAELNVGLIRGLERNQTREARELKGLGLLEADDIAPFYIPAKLPVFRQAKAQWPRSRDIYRAPILIIKETLSAGPRPIVAVADRDLIYTNAYFGAAMPSSDPRLAYLLAAILSSSLASWFFLMSASEFGIWKRRLLRHDVSLMPTPELRAAIQTEAGRKLLEMSSKFQLKEPSDTDWKSLDDAVFDLYGIDDADRIVVTDGLYRAGWQWSAGRENSVSNAAESELFDYAYTFMSVIDGWLSARGKRHIRAEILTLPQNAALRVIRFVLVDGPGQVTAQSIQASGSLEDVLSRIGKRMSVQIASALSTTRELRIHGRNEVVIIKPAFKRYWMKIVALEDADAVVAESFSGSST